MLVVLQQSGARETHGDLFDDLLDLIVFEPGVDDLELLAQHRQHNDLGRVSRCVAASACFILSVRSMTSQPKPASWSSSGFSTWFRSSSLMCCGVLFGDRICFSQAKQRKRALCRRGTEVSIHASSN